MKITSNQTTVISVKTKQEAFDYIDRNFYFETMNPKELKIKITKKDICKLPNGNLLIVDELGLLD